MSKRKGNKNQQKDQKQDVVLGDPDEISSLLVIIIFIQWIFDGASFPLFFKDIMYYPGWIIGITGFIFNSYVLIEVGFLKLFYRFRNRRIVQTRIDLKESQEWKNKRI